MRARLLPAVSAGALAAFAAWTPAAAQEVAKDAASEEPAPTGDDAASAEDSGSQTDILSADTLTLMFDGRLILADGAKSFADGGFGKTRFDGTRSGDVQLQAQPVEASLIWQPRFTSSLNGNVSIAWQNDQENPVDLLESYLTFLPARGGKVSFSAKAGLYWPEISLEHATGGAWSTVYTITPSAINSWVGEEVKVLGAEATISATLGSQDFSLTGGAFGFNDTSGTLLSFRGWALHDLKATAFGHFKLPPLNAFLSGAQQHETRSLYEIDNRVGFYGRAEWRPAQALVVNAFYYDNRGDPTKFTPSLQWGWRTRFWNFGLVADLGSRTKLVSQAMTGTTQMGFVPPNATEHWINTRFRSAFVLLSQRIGRGALSGRAE
ncbi:MAG: hypothetical protein J2O44_00705, partial [Porphyrobacter sp.]|nr:hypothetical protein [Porphyrobacter sp.]